MLPVSENLIEKFYKGGLFERLHEIGRIIYLTPEALDRLGMITPGSYYMSIPDFTLMLLNAHNELFRAEVLAYVRRQRIYVLNCNNTLLSYPVVYTRWVPPPPGMWKLTVDASVTEIAGVGGFLRDCNGDIGPVYQFIMKKKFDFCDPEDACYEAELYAVYYCLNEIFEAYGEAFCRNLRLTIECDNLRVVKALRSGVFPPDSSFQIKHSTVAELMGRFGYCSIEHILRQSNKAADYLAERARNVGYFDMTKLRVLAAADELITELRIAQKSDFCKGV